MQWSDLDQEHRLALLDLAVLGMYAVGHLAAVEDRRIDRLLGLLGMAGEVERNREYDASVARVRAHVGDPAAAIEHGVELASLFRGRDERRWVSDALRDLLASDGRVSEREGEFVEAVCDSLEEE
jgi:uncharacterized tellurite resistance protein B-like protein